jgi:hypothetical protein
MAVSQILLLSGNGRLNMDGKMSLTEKVFTFLVFLISYLLVTFIAVRFVSFQMGWPSPYPIFLVGLFYFPSALSWYFHEIVFEYSGWILNQGLVMIIGLCAYVIIALYATFAGNRLVAIILYGIFLLLLMANLLAIVQFMNVDM